MIQSISVRVMAILPPEHRPAIPAPATSPNIEIDQPVLDRLNAYCALTGAVMSCVASHAISDMLDSLERPHPLETAISRRARRGRKRKAVAP